MALFDLQNNLQGGTTPLDRQTNTQNSFDSDGFVVRGTPAADNNSLPSSKIPFDVPAKATRHIIHWFVPEVGIVKMYVNPNSIQYVFRKIIIPERTKGGYAIQYWGEDLPQLTISGHTGSSGVEGVNVLYEIYRSEQLTFDAAGLALASNAGSGVGDILNGFLKGAENTFAGITGLEPTGQNILPQNIPTLASLAYGVEMYYSGWVFRGFFTAMTITESADKLGLFDYTINFTVTQRRGYRTNYLPWHKSPITGPSDSESSHYTYRGTDINKAFSSSSKKALDTKKERA